MKRRRFFQSLAAAPTALLAVPQPQQPQSATSDLRKLETAAEIVTHFSNTDQMSTLWKLSDMQPTLADLAEQMRTGTV
jgi:hypothetical protein